MDTDQNRDQFSNFLIRKKGQSLPPANEVTTSVTAASRHLVSCSAGNDLLHTFQLLAIRINKKQTNK